MSEPDCPSREELFDYAVGRLSDDASENLASHLDACSTCQAMLATFSDANDSLLVRLRSPVLDDPLLAEPECVVALGRAKAVAGRPDASGQGPLDSSRSAVMAFPVPGQLGEYELQEELGHGGMGTVYKALHTKLDRVVALKVLAKGRVEDQRAIARFEREMKAIGRLDHPQIVRAHDAREIDGRPVLIMEYVEGLDLARLVRRVGRLRVPDACELARQAAVGLQYIQEHGLVHRDIKPSNLMLTPRGEIKILDLGLARFHRERGGSDEMTGAGQTMGTADYMAPEQTADSHSADIRADIYSLGCTLFKLLSGQAPFEGPAYRGTFAKMTAHVRTPAPSIRELAAGVPEELAALLGRMLAKDPEQRPATPADVAKSLEPFCAGHDLPALVNSGIGFQAVGDAVEIGPIDANPKRQRGNDLAPSLALRVSIGRRLEAYATKAFSSRRLLLGLLGLGLVLGLAWAVVLHIRRQGTDTTVQVPEGSDVKITEDGRVDVKLPDEAAQDKPKPLRPLVVDVDRDGTAAIAGMPIEDDRLQTLVGLLLGDTPRRKVRLRCDADLPFSRVADLLEVLKLAGMPRSSVWLATAPIPAARLDFRVAAVGQVSNLSPAMPGKDGIKPSFTEAELKRCREDLQSHGPTYGRAAREQARRIARHNAIADMIGLLAGIEKASVRVDAPSVNSDENPAVSVTVAVQTPTAEPPGEALLQQVRVLVIVALPGIDPDHVKVVEATEPAVDEKAKDPMPAAVTPATGEHYAWFELAAEAPSPPTMSTWCPTAAHEGRKYVLLSVRPEDTMVAGDEGPRRWRIADASLGKTDGERPTVQVALDDAGARRMAALSEAHRGEFLAALIDGRAVCLSKIQAKMAAQVEIDGNFDARQAQRVLRGLLGPFAGGSEDTNSPEEEDSPPPPMTGGGFF